MFGNKNSMKQIEVMVFNRIGEKVFESNDLNFSWDGKFKGIESPNAVYVYTAKIVWLNNHSDSDYKGTITLIR
jgi:gliding motility-associated-like protein